MKKHPSLNLFFSRSIRFSKWKLHLMGVLFLFITSGSHVYAKSTGLLGILASNDIGQNAKNVTLRGTVLDESGKPVAGATVIEAGTKGQNGTASDGDGKFSISLSPESSISIKCIGYEPKNVDVNGKNDIAITLKEESTSLNEVVLVGYGVQKKATLTGSVASIKGETLSKIGQPSLKANMLGSVPGIRFQQTNGEPGDDGGTFDIRGFGNPLTIIDGIERPFSQIDPNEIESISILKDASASVYGFRGANGVLIIQTKQGANAKPKISYSYNYGLQAPVKNLQMMDAYSYAYYRNEALLNGGGIAQYSNEELEKYRTGSDPVNYPSTDWYAETVRKAAPKQQHNLNISGGSDQLKYFFSFGYLNQEGILKSTQNFDRYNFRSNITAKMSERLSAEVGLGGRMENRKYPYYLGDQGVALFTAIKSNAPNQSVYANNNPDYYNNSDNNQLNPVAMLDRNLTGHKDRRDLEFNSQIALTYKIMKGLSAKALVAFDFTNVTKSNFKREVNLFSYNNITQKYDKIVKVAVGQMYQQDTLNYRTTQQYSLNYAKSFNEKHNFSVLALMELKEANNGGMSAIKTYSVTTGIDELSKGDPNGVIAEGNSDQYKYIGYVGRLNYDYAGKYLLEASFRYDGSYKTSPLHRWGFFPAVSGGWRASEEEFIKDALPNLTNLKFRASWGKIGDDAGLDASQFMSGWKYPIGSYILGGASDGSTTITKGLSKANLANPGIFWYKVQTTNLGVDASMWNNKLTLEFDYFYRKTTGKFAKRLTSIPTSFGSEMPFENLNSDDNRGFELSLGTVQKVGEVRFQIKGNVAYSRAKSLYKEQAAPANQYLNYRNNTVNRFSNTTWGYVYTGQFQSYEEIYNSPIQDGKGNSTLRPGDLKYQDINGDGSITDLDQKVVGKGSFPDVNYGLSLNTSWKGLDLNVLFQGACNYTQTLNAVKSPFRGPGEGNGFQVWEDRWHKADYTDLNSEWIAGDFPSLRIDGNENNGRTSSYWMTNAYYVRLKSIELGYTLPKSLLEKTGIGNVRVYANAYNPLTVTNVKYTDPEAVEGWMSFYYPQLKVFSFGINITL